MLMTQVETPVGIEPRIYKLYELDVNFLTVEMWQFISY